MYRICLIRTVVWTRSAVSALLGSPRNVFPRRFKFIAEICGSLKSNLIAAHAQDWLELRRVRIAAPSSALTATVNVIWQTGPRPDDAVLWLRLPVFVLPTAFLVIPF